MKKIYYKPTLKSVTLWASEQLMTGSQPSKNIYEETADGNEALSNKEGVHNIWGNENNSIW